MPENNVHSINLTENVRLTRDRFGVTPLYYTVQGDILHYAYDVTSLLPFLPSIETDLEGFADYITFQYCLNGKTLFKGIKELPPSHWLATENGAVKIGKYSELAYKPDYDHTEKYFVEKTRHLLEQAVKSYSNGDKLSCYLSGGIDSSAVAALADSLPAYHGKFIEQGYQESYYARLVAKQHMLTMKEVEITAKDFMDNIRDAVHCLGYPMMGPGLISQYMVAKRAAKDGTKTMLGGQGGDEVFGGYPKYIIMDMEQSFGERVRGDYGMVEWMPMMKLLWGREIFNPLEERYFKAISRADGMSMVRWDALGSYNPYFEYLNLFKCDGLGQIDQMMRYELLVGLPPMLQVEYCIATAHGMDVRFPMLYPELVEFMATVPSEIKLKNRTLKYLLRQAMKNIVPDEVLERKDKMGFTTPFVHWCQHEAQDFVHDILGSQKALQRDLMDNGKALQLLDTEAKYGRSLWACLCLELWQEEFLDLPNRFKKGE